MMDRSFVERQLSGITTVRSRFAKGYCAGLENVHAQTIAAAVTESG
jgi:hypothetical protein